MVWLQPRAKFSVSGQLECILSAWLYACDDWFVRRCDERYNCVSLNGGLFFRYHMPLLDWKWDTWRYSSQSLITATMTLSNGSATLDGVDYTKPGARTPVSCFGPIWVDYLLNEAQDVDGLLDSVFRKIRGSGYETRVEKEILVVHCVHLRSERLIVEGISQQKIDRRNLNFMLPSYLLQYVILMTSNQLQQIRNLLLSFIRDEDSIRVIHFVQPLKIFLPLWIP